MKFQINKKWLAVFIVSSVVFGVVGLLTYRSLMGGEPLSLLSPWGGEVVFEEPRIFDRYSFPALARREYRASEIKLEKNLRGGEKFDSYVFSYLSDGKKITGMLNVPSQARLEYSEPGSEELKGKFPVVILVRGFVPDEIYQTGVGTQKAADFFASYGFLTLAPDFLGFGGSDATPAVGALSDLADRFEKPVTILNLFASIKTLPQADPNKIFLWGHSNGGQVALSVLEITKRSTPTVLWAPVTKPFPYNILYFSDEPEDNGKYLRKLLAEFEKDYDANLYSIHTYLQDIVAPLQLHQGTIDDAVPIKWSDQFYGKMEALGKEVEYFKYEGADHNLRGGWDLAAQRSLEFYKTRLRHPEP